MSKLSLISVAALVASAGVASAAKNVANDSVFWNENTAVTQKSLPTVSSRQGQIIQVPVAGIESRDAQGAGGNVVVNLNLGAGTIVNGIGWNVVLTAEGESWQSEMAVGFGSGGTTFINLRPGAGVNSPGQGAFTSNGIIKLSTVPLPDMVVAADGILRLEFFETFDDVAGVRDGIWKSGFINLQIVPTPGAASLFGLAGLAAARRRRA